MRTKYVDRYIYRVVIMLIRIGTQQAGWGVIGPKAMICAASLLMLSACTSLPGDSKSRHDGPGRAWLIDSGKQETPQNLPKSRYGNMKEYTVFGKTYQVMESSEGYQERGEASWYGSKFHGRKTSSGEVYSMYDMTAAHKSLPLPTFVEVKNVANGRTIIVKVNDRGPFHGGRIIDLSYTAAARLGMLETGTGEVIVTALTTHVPDAEIKTPGPTVIQVGAFEDVSRAEALRQQVNNAFAADAAYIEREGDSVLHHVRFGVAGGASVQPVLSKLQQAGITQFSIIQ